VRSLAADPRNARVVYLGTLSGGLYRSEDQGLHWQRLVPGFPLPGMSLDDLVVDPSGIVYAGYWEVRGGGGGVARSTDGGRSFTVLEGIRGQSVRSLAVAPSNPQVLVAGTLTGVFRSRDGGETWSRISPEDDPELRNVDSIAVDYNDSETIYAGTWHLPWKTRDGGRSWRSIHLGIIDDSDIMTMTVDRRLPSLVYATACSGIYRTRDAGERWTKVRGIPSSSRRTRAFALNPDRPDVLYAGTTQGFWVSEDAGNSWKLRSDPSLVVNAVLVLTDGTLLLGCDGAGVRRSRNGGVLWTDSSAGFSERFVSRILFDLGGDRLLAGILGDRQYGGVFTASRADGAWTRLAPGLEGREVLSLAVGGTSVFVGTDAGVYVAAGGGPWRKLPTSPDGRETRALDVAAVSDRVVLVATPSTLLRTADGGEHWEKTSAGMGAVNALAISSLDPSRALAASPIAFYASRDAGASWEAMAEAPQDGRVYSLAFLPGSDHVVFAATSRGLFKSDDAGRTWRVRGGGLPQLDITGLALHPDGRTVVASDFSSGGLWRSPDGGETWTAFPTDGLVSRRVWAVALDPKSPMHVVAAASAGGLHEWLAAAETAVTAGQ
jgi:photosystem II stability/assembly factor-like uncharacterized protein